MPWIELISRSTRHQVRSGMPGISAARSPGRPPLSYGPRRAAAQQGLEVRMPPSPDLRSTLLAAWRTNNRVTVHLVQCLPTVLWDIAVPGVPRRTIRMIAAHLHNARCMWVKTLGREHGIPAPTRVDQRRVARRQLVAALKHSSNGIAALLKLGLEAGGQILPSGGMVRPQR